MSRQGIAMSMSSRARQGQILLLFALFLTVLMGALGLSVDLGVSFAERRAMQNAADAAALAGARVVAKAASTSGLSAQSDAATVAGKNAMSIGAIDQVSCNYVDDTDASVGSCSATVPSTATGVTVTVYETHPTYFVRVVPGAPSTVRVSATSTAHVLKLAGYSDGPFIVCGSQDPNNSSLPPILKASGSNWVINPAAIGVNYTIHGPQINGCNTKGNRFKGLANEDANANLTAPNWFNYDTGTKAGPTRTKVDGINGCQAGQAADQCVLILPIAVDNPPEQGNSKSTWVVAFAPFWVQQTGANTHSGTLLSNYIIYGSGQTATTGWNTGYIGPIAIRITS
jgi:Flp pilus assembly protein TadG